jgi:hypothetical protein
MSFKNRANFYRFPCDAGQVAYLNETSIDGGNSSGIKYTNLTSIQEIEKVIPEKLRRQVCWANSLYYVSSYQRGRRKRIYSYPETGGFFPRYLKIICVKLLCNL